MKVGFTTSCLAATMVVYLPYKPHQEIPKQKQLTQNIDLKEFIKAAATILDCDLNRFVKSARIAPSDKADNNLP